MMSSLARRVGGFGALLAWLATAGAAAQTTPGATDAGVAPSTADASSAASSENAAPPATPAASVPNADAAPAQAEAAPAPASAVHAPLPVSAVPGAAAAPSATIPPAATASPAASTSSRASSASDESYGAVAVTPAPGARIQLDKVPRNVQRVDAATIADEQALGLQDVLNARLGSATINDVQNNPLQPDLQYRGFTASPLLGTPQGMAVYQNGVRINEPFGDLLQWDLVPTFALHELQLIPGANPVYGLNALGGSLVLRMKDGFRDQGYRVQALGGSFGRYQSLAEFGRAFGDWAVYAGVSAFGEQGFRDESPSSARNLYADVRHERDGQEIGLSVTLGHTSLNGNGPAPVELLAQDRSALYTFPDNTRNDLLMVQLDTNQRLLEHWTLQATAYLRHAERSTFNGDEAEFAPCTASSAAGLLCDENGTRLRTESKLTIPASAPYDALYNRTAASSDGYGGSLQLAVDAPLGEHANQLIAGASYDGAQVGFRQRAELAQLTAERGVQGAGLFLTGEAFRTQLAVDNRLLGVYVSDTWNIAAPLALNVAARLNWANAELEDRLGTSLSGNHFFARVNPAIGLTYTPIAALTVFTGYGEANRTPSAAELGCADPDRPCRVPNAFIADPPLKQVVSRSVELGVRGRAGTARKPRLEGSLAGFLTRNEDDILFIAGSRVGTGFFENAGVTQRIGLEAALSGRAGVLDWYASYTFLRATFESELALPGGGNPRARHEQDARVIDVGKGDRIPGLPAHAVKAGFTLHPIARFAIGLSAIAQSSQPFRGDEANLLSDLAGYLVLNAHASYRAFDSLTFLVKARNLLNTDYETFGALADPSQVLPHAGNPRFVSPGAPLGVWAGIALHEPVH
jgi:outer membrane receptor protein involved in Fe transport